MNSRRRVNSTVMLLLKSVLLFVLLAPPVVLAQLPNVPNAPLDKLTLNLFAQYPDTDELKMLFHSHAYREGLNKSDLVFFSTWFVDGRPGVVMETSVDAHGCVYTVRTEYDWARQNFDSRQLTESELQSTFVALKTLPDSAQQPPLPFLVVVSFKLDSKWQTKLYDRRNLPAEMVEVYQLVHSVVDAK